jgi:hypothetical protein
VKLEKPLLTNPLGKEVIEVNRKILMAVLAMAASIVFTAVAPAFAKNFNIPEGQNRSYTSGGSGIIVTPEGFFIPELRLQANNVEIGIHGSGNNLGISMFIQIPDGSIVTVPIAWFTTNPNPDVIVYLQTLLSGFPASGLPNNIRYVSDSALTVERHGNSIHVELTAPQTILIATPTSGVVPVVIPAFTMELNKVGGSVHKETITSLTGYPGASGYTGYIEEMGFNAEGTFSSLALNYDAQPMTDCFITMHGITTYVPP